MAQEDTLNAKEKLKEEAGSHIGKDRKLDQQVKRKTQKSLRDNMNLYENSGG